MLASYTILYQRVVPMSSFLNDKLKPLLTIYFPPFYLHSSINYKRCKYAIFIWTQPPRDWDLWLRVVLVRVWMSSKIIRIHHDESGWSWVIVFGSDLQTVGSVPRKTESLPRCYTLVLKLRPRPGEETVFCWESAGESWVDDKCSHYSLSSLFSYRWCIFGVNMSFQ